MRAVRTLFAGASSAALMVVAATSLSAQNAAHAHIGHVADEWRDTPESMGLLPAAQAEAAVAEQHAGLAMANPDDLAAIQRHMGHVAHALDPSATDGGPGKGYGLIKAAEGASAHIHLAAEAEGASDNVKGHATHVGTSADNAATWGRTALEKAQAAMATSDLSTAQELAGEVHHLTLAIAEGTDADGDGKVSWGEGEGGLAQASQHLGLMKKGEGMQ